MIVVVGRHDGGEVTRFVLGHGLDPRTQLAMRGWDVVGVQAVGAHGDLVLQYDVAPLPAAAREVAAEPPPLGPGLGARERADVVPRQRLAAYAVVVDAGRLLLTQLSSSTGAAGRWTLPGGGVDPEESPRTAVVREVLEETGQVVDEVVLLDVMTSHWVGGVGGRGRRPEDHHAVRLVHAARCPVPTDPVVHDVGGSTSDARWVPLAEVEDLPLVPTVPWALRVAGVVG